MAAPMPRPLRAGLLLLLVACAQAQYAPHAHMTHASARDGAAPVTPIRGDYIGTQFITSAPCMNSLTCSPASCLKGTNAACAVANNQGPTTNKTNAAMAATLATIQSRTCTVSSDARCTTAALTAVFGHYPGILAAYCNDAYLVVHSSGLPAHPNSLSSIYTPPGGGTCANGANPCGYKDQCVTRDFASAYAVYKFPLVPTLLTTSSGTVNNAQMTMTIPPSAVNAGLLDSNNLLNFNGLTSMPTRGPVAVSVSGQNMFPVMNNNGGLTFPSCETDMCNAHAGQGFDLHYHGDPFGPQCLYSCANYSSVTAHPPLIGYGLDGVPMFGRYLSSSAPGASVALDDCGGHNHTGVGDPFIADGSYHYHAFVSNITSLNYAAYVYQAPVYGPFMCWKGNISAIPSFFESNANPTARTDYASGLIQPCTGNSNMYMAPGFALNGVTGAGFNYSGKVYTTGAGSVGGACTATPSTPSTSQPAYVAAAIQLGGYSVATFGTGEALAFRTAVATKTGATSPASVTITSVAAAPSGRRRTHAAGDAVVVSFTVTTTTAASAAVSSAAAAISTTDFTSTGLAVTAVTVTTAPAATATVPVDVSAALVTTPAVHGAAASAASAVQRAWLLIAVLLASALTL